MFLTHGQVQGQVDPPGRHNLDEDSYLQKQKDVIFQVPDQYKIDNDEASANNREDLMKAGINVLGSQNGGTESQTHYRDGSIDGVMENQGGNSEGNLNVKNIVEMLKKILITVSNGKVVENDQNY